MSPLCYWCLWAVLGACAATPLAASASSPMPAQTRPELTASASAVSARKLPAVPAGMVSVWVDLDLPALAEVPRAEREALRSNILTQQTEVMRGLHALGAQELARVQQVRNAVAVRLDAAQIAAASALPGVRSVRVVRDIERGPPIPKTSRQDTPTPLVSKSSE
jgi:hypothetical protein